MRVKSNFQTYLFFFFYYSCCAVVPCARGAKAVFPPNAAIMDRRGRQMEGKEGETGWSIFLSFFLSLLANLGLLREGSVFGGDFIGCSGRRRKCVWLGGREARARSPSFLSPETVRDAGGRCLATSAWRRTRLLRGSFLEKKNVRKKKRCDCDTNKIMKRRWNALE